MSLAEQLDFYVEFKEWYFKIIEDFEFDHDKDLEARDYLNSLLEERPNSWNLELTLEKFKKTIQEKQTIFIYGCGPSLEPTVNTLLDSCGLSFFERAINLAADGAAVYLLEKGIPIDATFSDLDGITEKELDASRFMVVHAHGDNIDKLQEFKNAILTKEHFIGTTQVESNGEVINAGGFTDGDRILFFLRTLLKPNQVIYLIGMDFKDKIGKYSKPNFEDNIEANPIKRKKLDYAIELVNWFRTLVDNPLYFIGSPSTSNAIRTLSLNKIVENYNPYNL